MKNKALSILLITIGYVSTSSFASFNAIGDPLEEFKEAICLKQWQLQKTITKEGEEKPDKNQKTDYMLFNADQTVILYEKGKTNTANWFFDPVTKSLTLNYTNSDKSITYIVYRLDKKNLILIDFVNKKRMAFKV